MHTWLAARLDADPFGYHEEIAAEPVPVTTAALVDVDPVPPSVPSLTPRSRATWAIGLPVSRTSRIAPRPEILIELSSAFL
jgi:hypothetical protein